jgi:hypothetical protein
MNTEKTIERINSLTGELSTLAHKLRGKNDRAGQLAYQALETARHWLIIAAEEDDAKDPFSLPRNDDKFDDNEAA